MAESRRIALASPLQHARLRFAVGGQSGPSGSGDVKVYEWHRERREMRMIGLQMDIVGQIRAMAWSPHPNHPSTIALGLSTGRTLIYSLSASTLSPSPSVPCTPLATLHIKHSRPVTSLSFSPLDPNYIAGGLERHRSDHSLLIWDVAEAISTLPPEVAGEGDPSWRRPQERIGVSNPHVTSRVSEPRHLQAFCASELVNCVAFLPAQYSLLASANNRQIRLFDLRASHSSSQAAPKDSAAAAAGAVMQFQTKAVYGLTPHPTRTETFASYENTQQGAVVRLWDLRKGGETMHWDVIDSVVGMEWWGQHLGVGMKDAGVAMWDVVSGLMDEAAEDRETWTIMGGVRQIIKPKQNLQSFAFASHSAGGEVLFVGRDGVINIGPISVASPLATSPQGELALTASSADTRILTPFPSPGTQPEPYRSAQPPASGQSPQAQRSPVRQNRFQLPPSPEAGYASISTSPRHGAAAALSGSARRRIPQDIKEADDESDPDGEDGQVRRGGYEVYRSLAAEDVAVVMRRRAEEGYGLMNMMQNAQIIERHYGVDALEGVWEFVHHLVAFMHPSNSRSANSHYDLTHSGIWSMWTSQTTTHIAPTARAHSASLLQPTGTDRRSNSASGDSSTREPIKQGSAAWASLKLQAQAQAVTSTTSLSPTSTLLSVSGDSTGKSGFRPRTQSTTTRASGGPGGRGAPNIRPINIPNPDEEFIRAVAAMNQARIDVGQGIGRHALPSGDKQSLRRMILGLCGENHDFGAMVEINRLIKDDQRTKAAAWAFFASEETQAIKMLVESADPQHRLTGATLATALARGSTHRKLNKDDWTAVIQGVNDPYIRCVLRRIAGESWDTILREGGREGLPLTDRIAIAVCNMEDIEFSNLLVSLYPSARDPTPPDMPLSHIPLLGLTPLILPMLQAHLDSTGDVQTIAILAALIPPRLLTEGEQARVNRWTEAYRDVLDSWGMFAARVEFDVKRQEIAAKLGGEALHPQKGNCPVCNHVLSRQELDHSQRKIALKGSTTWPNERTLTCTFCGNALARCVICLQLVEPRFKSGHGLDDDYFPTGHELVDTVETAYIACQTCRHGGHANHILPWFEGGLDGQPGHDVCAVAGCECECASI